MSHERWFLSCYMILSLIIVSILAPIAVPSIGGTIAGILCLAFLAGIYFVVVDD